MRVLWLSHLVPWPPSSGVLQRSHHLLRQAARRHEVWLLALSPHAFVADAERVAAARGALAPPCAGVEILPLDVRPRSARWLLATAVGLLRSTPYDVRWLRSRVLRARLRERGFGEGFDLVHVDTIGLAHQAAHLPNAARVLHHHNVESHMLARRARREPRRWARPVLAREARKLERMEREVCGGFELNVVVSELDGERLRRVAPDARVHVVENGVDLEHFRGASGSGRSGSLVFVGGMDWYPNRDAALHLVREIWPALAADDAGRRLTLVGAHPPPEVREAARDPRVRVTGFVDDVRPYVEQAAVYVCPIRDGGGTRLKVLDALAMARPLVATAMAVEGVGIRDGVHFLRAERPEEFVAAVRRLTSDAALALRLARAGRRFVEEHHGWDRIGAQLDRAYAQAAAARRLTGAAPGAPDAPPAGRSS